MIALGVPLLGSTLRATTECSFFSPLRPTISQRSVFLLTGVLNTAFGEVRLTFDISTLALGQPWCGLLRTSIEVVLPVRALEPRRSVTETSIAVPNALGLADVTFYRQAISIETTSIGRRTRR
ncbi:MAG: hypothetical protein R3F56_16630 [Planctomycetota bacterium]